MTELTKKNDDYKRAYNEMKTNFGKAQKDLEEVKGPQRSDANEQEIKEKYESLKVKHKKLDDARKQLEAKVSTLETQMNQKSENLDNVY